MSSISCVEVHYYNYTIITQTIYWASVVDNPKHVINDFNY